MHFLGIYWVGINAQNGRKLALSLGFLAIVLLVSWVIRWLVGAVLTRTKRETLHAKFWTRQAISILTVILIVLGLLSIWFNNPKGMTTAFGLMSAGLAFALQQVVTSIAGYFVILRGRIFAAGDRISMGGVRGDVVRVGFIQTTIMEMGEPPNMQGGSRQTWVRSRQFTGRIATVTNSRIFTDPVFNYTREFPFIWEEMSIPITYKADRKRVEEILLEAARLHALNPDSMTIEAKENLQKRFGVQPIDLPPRVFYRLTDNWLELTVRFLLHTHGIRIAKDAMSRHIITALDEAGIGIASATYDIVGLPPIEIRDRPRP